MDAQLIRDKLAQVIAAAACCGGGATQHHPTEKDLRIADAVLDFMEKVKI